MDRSGRRASRRQALATFPSRKDEARSAPFGHCGLQLFMTERRGVVGPIQTEPYRLTAIRAVRKSVDNGSPPVQRVNTKGLTSEKIVCVSVSQVPIRVMTSAAETRERRRALV